MSAEKGYNLVDTAAVAVALGAVGTAVPALKKFNVKGITITNVSGVTVTVRVRLGATSYAVYDLSLSAGQSYVATGLQAVMVAASQVQAMCSTLNGVTILIAGVEEDQ